MGERQDGAPKILKPESFPAIHASVHETPRGTLYLRSPGAVMISGPAVDIAGMREFLAGYPREYGFFDYLADPTSIASGEQLAKVAGQVCYASFGEQRTLNRDAKAYINNIISSGHGSVLEHVNYSFLLYGISRACSHEIVRHRVGVGYSQLSQRYVSGKVLRFVERPEYQRDAVLHELFEQRIDRARTEYEELAERLLVMQKRGDGLLAAEQRTDRRKRVQQTARSLLPNETETVMVMTGNVRAWRHIISMRVNEHAEVEIRKAMYNVFLILREVAPLLLADYEVTVLSDGTHAVETPYPKV